MPQPGELKFDSQGYLLVNAGSTAQTSSSANPAQDGTDATDATPPAGAVGIRGWLSGIYGLLTGTLKVQGVAGGVPQPVITPLAPPITGQVKIATTGTAVALPNNALVNGLVVKAKATNMAQSGTYSGMVGPSGVTTLYDGTGPGYPLAPGEAASFAVANSNTIYVNGTAGDVFTFQGN